MGDVNECHKGTLQAEAPTPVLGRLSGFIRRNLLDGEQRVVKNPLCSQGNQYGFFFLLRNSCRSNDSPVHPNRFKSVYAMKASMTNSVKQIVDTFLLTEIFNEYRRRPEFFLLMHI
jgi:hypothetical protein